MPPGDYGRIRTIASAEGGCEWEPPLPGDVHDVAIPREQALIAEPESAEFVLAMRVDAGLIEDQARPRPIDHAWQIFSQYRQIIGIAKVVGKRDVVARPRLFAREIMLAVHREGGDGGAVGGE